MDLNGGDCVSDKGSLPTDKWTAEADAYENKLRYVDFGSMIEVIYGDFEKIAVEKKDKKTGKPYPATDWKVGIRKDGKRKVVRLNEYNFSLMVRKAQEIAKANGGKFPETFAFQVPYPSGSFR